MYTYQLEKKRKLTGSAIEAALIILLSLVPLFSTFPYRVNIFLSWEGAYRLSIGEVPYRDFGMPLGYMFWVIPAIFFKLFGVQMITLVKAQVFINIMSGFAFRSILKSIGVDPAVRLVSVLLYCLSYSFFNFWPWYNHTVIVYEIVGLAFLFRFLFSPQVKWNWIYLVLSALFTFFSFFTKQDAGGMAFLLCCLLLLYNCISRRAWISLPVYIVIFLAFAFLFIYPLTRYNFGYWFNHGQPPHTSRVDIRDILDEFFYSSQWIKFYLFLIVFLLAVSFKREMLFRDKKNIFFLLLTLGILGEAAILQVTSYTPPDNNIFFHSFAFAFILASLVNQLHINLYKRIPLIICLAGIILWWSGTYWKYFQKITQRVASTTPAGPRSDENIVTRKTYKIDPYSATDIPMSEWKYSGLAAFDKIYMPGPTVNGIQRLMSMEMVKNKKDLRVLNMSELTPLAAEMHYKLETGTDQPLWYHLGVAMFNRQAAMFEQRIMRKEYDLVLFENIPSLNNFYPFRVRDSLKVYYQKVDSFAAPRRGDTQGMIEVYTK